MRMNWFDSEVGPNEGWVSLTKQRWVNSGQRQRQRHLPALLCIVGNAFGALPLQPTAREFWNVLLARCGDLASATRQLVQQFHTSLFGTYRCHQRRQLRAA
jgi:hypothetical protein